jgi:hypothetical protein
MTLSSRLTVPLCFVYVEMALLWILVENYEEEDKEEKSYFLWGWGEGDGEV